MLIDEYSSPTLKAEVINQLSCGTSAIKIKFQRDVMFETILLVCGNKHPREVYPNAFPLIEARFNIINLEDCADPYDEENPPKEDYIPMY